MDTGTREEILRKRRLADRKLRECEERMTAWATMHGGIKESQGRCCLRRLMGLKCLMRHIDGCEGCRQKKNRIWDHPSLWNKDGKPYIIVLHAYDLYEDDLAQLRVYCTSSGLVCNVRPKEESFYLPSATWMIEILREGAPAISEKERLKFPNAE
jgi:hypothetical protein